MAGGKCCDRGDAEHCNRGSADDRRLPNRSDSAAASNDLFGCRAEGEIGRQLAELFAEVVLAHEFSSRAGENAGTLMSERSVSERSVSERLGERRSLASAFDDVLFTVPTDTPTCAATSASLR